MGPRGLPPRVRAGAVRGVRGDRRLAGRAPRRVRPGHGARPAARRAARRARPERRQPRHPAPRTPCRTLPAFCAHVERLMAAAGARSASAATTRRGSSTSPTCSATPNNWCDENRTVHLGIDVFCEAGCAGLRAARRRRAQRREQRRRGRLRADDHPRARGGRGARPVLHALRPPERWHRSTGMTPGRRVGEGERIAWLGDADGERRLAAAPALPGHRRHARAATGEFPGVAAPGERDDLAEPLPRRQPDRSAFPADRLPAAAGAARRDPGGADGARSGRNLSVSYRAPDHDGARLRAVPLRRGRPPLPGRRQQRAARRPQPPARRRSRRAAAGGAQHEHPLPARRARRLRRAPVRADARRRSASATSCAAAARPTSWRCASRAAYTGHRDFVVLDGAYHGNTTSLVEISPYKFDGPGRRRRARRTCTRS